MMRFPEQRSQTILEIQLMRLAIPSTPVKCLKISKSFRARAYRRRCVICATAHHMLTVMRLEFPEILD